MYSFRSILLGTIFTICALGLAYFVVNLVTGYTIGKTAVEVFSILDSTRESMHQTIVNHSAFLSFITTKIFFQVLLCLALLGVWFTNINWVENGFNRRGGENNER